MSDKKIELYKEVGEPFDLSDVEREKVIMQRAKESWVTFVRYTESGHLYYVPKGRKHKYEWIGHTGNDGHYVKYTHWDFGYRLPEGSYTVRLEGGKLCEASLRHKATTIKWWDGGEFRAGGNGDTTAKTHSYVVVVGSKTMSLEDVEIKVSLSKLERGCTKYVRTA
jgi:hypothetical protein